MPTYIRVSEGDVEKRARDRIDDDDALNCAKGSRIVRDFNRGLAMGDEVLGLKLRNFRHNIM